MAFQSEFEDSQKLKDCAEKDIDHVGEQFAPDGPWVVLIKKALNAWAAKQRPPVTPPLPETPHFGTETGDRVALYKSRQTPPILNFANKIDRVVGKKTVVALDKELPARRSPTPPGPVLTMSALATRDKPLSILWARGAISGLSDTRDFLINAPPIMTNLVAVTFEALETHFHLSTATIPQVDFINQVLAIYQKSLNILLNSGVFFIDDTTSAEARGGTPAHVPFGSGKVNFTPAFKERSGTTGFGPNCRAAMVLHEPVHIADHPAASAKLNHVNENDPTYESQPAMRQLHNPHSYASFGQQVFFNGNDTRFGIGKPSQ